MSVVVIPFPNRRTIKPALSECLAAVALCEHDPSLLLLTAAAATRLVHKAPWVSDQVAVDRLTIAFLALAELLGVTKEGALL
jgi:hypothetical protein